MMGVHSKSIAPMRGSFFVGARTAHATPLLMSALFSSQFNGLFANRVSLQRVKPILERLNAAL